jgi:hypothetical protein
MLIARRVSLVEAMTANLDEAAGLPNAPPCCLAIKSNVKVVGYTSCDSDTASRVGSQYG